MKINLLNKKIPTILGVFLLIVSIGIGIFFITKGGMNQLGLNPNITPKNITISNIADNQFTVSWLTDEKTDGFIKYDTTPNLTKAANDDRQQLSSENAQFYLHYVTLKDLQPTKTYYFKIGSSGKLFDNKGQAYSITTSPVLGSTGEAKIVSGRILSADNNPASEVIVNLSTTSMAPLSALTDKEGRWAIFLNKARSIDLSSYTIFDPEATILKIDVLAEKQTASAVTITKNAFPVPDIVLGHEAYDFREVFAEQKKESPEIVLQNPTQPTATIEPETSITPSIQPNTKQPSQFTLAPISSSSATPTQSVTIDNPAKDNEQLNTLRPEFQGSGPAFKVLTVKIESTKTISSTVTINKDGEWSFTPTSDLTTGNHTISLAYVNNLGETETVKRPFYVLAAGKSDLPALTATYSAKPSPITRKTMPSTDSGVPTTGVVMPTFAVLIAGILLITIGFIFLLVDKHHKF